MKIGLYAGSFDPPTLGHLDVIKRASSFIDHLIVGVFNNSEKTPLFTTDERVNMLEDILKDYKKCGSGHIFRAVSRFCTRKRCALSL